jgi:type II secretory pathway component PulK
MRPGYSRRTGMALMVVVVALAALTMIMAGLTWQTLARQRFLERREQQFQAYWLAQAGIEHAVAKLLTDPKGYQGEVLELLPQTQVQIKIQPVKDQEKALRITSEARLTLDRSDSVVRSAERVFRMNEEGQKVQVEPLASETPPKKGPQ